jgi:ATP-dependent helicase/nuclease subunit A
MEVTGCLRAPSLATIWTRIDHADVWRERAFEIVLDDAWVTGIFDRVVVERDARGTAQWVTVFDFKTDRVSDGAAIDEALKRHGSQLNLYRRVAAKFVGLPVDAVTCELVFTQALRKVRVPAG